MTDQLEKLCDHVQSLAIAQGEESLREKRSQAEALVNEARSQADAKGRALVASADERVRKSVQRELQNARLAALRRIAASQWEQLTSVLDAAEAEIQRMRETDPERYFAALQNLFHSAVQQLETGEVLVKAHPNDIGELRERLRGMADEIIFEPDDIAAGLVVSSFDGNMVVDQSMARRRQRNEQEVRLVAQDILWREGLQTS